MSKKFVWRLGIYTVLMGYLLLDLFVIQGPVRKFTQQLGGSGAGLRDTERQVVARVFLKPIFMGQVNQRVEQMLFRSGRTLADARADELKLLRRAAVQDLVDLELLSVKVGANGDEYPLSEEQIDAALAQLKLRFTDEQTGKTDGFEASFAEQGITEPKEIRYRVAAKLQRDAYIEQKLKLTLEVSDAQAREWYEQHQKQLMLPERVRVKQIFIARLGHETDGAALAASVLQKLKSGAKGFDELVIEYSEDPNSKKRSGDLGWIKKGRLLEEFCDGVFELEKNKPRVVTTKIGWHVVELIDRKPAQLPSFASVKAEIVAAIRVERRPLGLKEIKRQLRKMHAERVVIDWRQIDEG